MFFDRECCTEEAAVPGAEPFQVWSKVLRDTDAHFLPAAYLTLCLWHIVGFNVQFVAFWVSCWSESSVCVVLLCLRTAHTCVSGCLEGSAVLMRNVVGFFHPVLQLRRCLPKSQRCSESPSHPLLFLLCAELFKRLPLTREKQRGLWGPGAFVNTSSFSSLLPTWSLILIVELQWHL